MRIKKLVQWAGEVPRLVEVLTLSRGLWPLLRVRFGRARSARLLLRSGGTIGIVDRVSGMVFVNIWIRNIYPGPRNGEVVLDLGANVGLFTIYALRHGARFCYCVEPCPESINHLSAHLREWGLERCAKVIPAAVGPTAGRAYIPQTSRVTNSLQPEFKPGFAEVSVWDVKDLLESLDPPPTYIKMDIESNEGPTLERMACSRSFREVRIVTVEIVKGADAIAAILRSAGMDVEIQTFPETIVTGRRQ